MTTTPPRKKPVSNTQIPNWMDPLAATMGIAAPYLKRTEPPVLNKVRRAYDPELNDYRVLAHFNESTGKGWVYSTPKKAAKNHSRRRGRSRSRSSRKTRARRNRSTRRR